MKRVTLIGSLLLIILSQATHAQSGPLAYILPADERVFIVLANTPRDVAAFDVYRRGPNDKDFRLITPAPIRPVEDAHEAARLMGTDFRWLARRIGSLEPEAVWRKLRYDRGQAMAYSLISHGLRLAMGRTYIDEEVKRDTTYRYRIQLLDSDGRNAERIERDIRITSPLKPDPPTSITAVPRDREVLITWEYPEYSGKDEDTTVGFHLYRKTGNNAKIRLTSAPVLRVEGFLSYLDQELDNGVAYTYELASVNIIGIPSSPVTTPPVIPIDNKPPLVPGDLTAIEHEEGILLIWRMAAELDLASYNVYTASALGEEEELAVVNAQPIPADTPRFIHRDAKKGSLSIYRVTAVDSSGNESAPSGPASIVRKDPDPPVAVSGVAGTTDPQSRQVELTWNPSPEDDLLGYHVYRGSDEKTLQRLAGEVLTETSFLDDGYEGRGLSAGARLLYAVSAVDTSYNEGELTIVIIDIPDIVPPAPPAGLAARIFPDGSVRLRWQPQYVPDLSEAGVYRKTDASWESVTRVDALIGEWTDTNTVRGEPVFYRVTQIDTVGNESGPSTEIEVVPTDVLAPDPPVLSHVVEDKGGITVLWNESPSDDLAGYRIYWSSYMGGRWRLISDEIITATQYHDRKGKPERIYGVSSVDTSGNESAVSTGRNAE